MKIKNYKLKIEKLGFLSFPLIFIASLILFYPSLSYYFFQDDWFVLNWVRTGNFWDLLKFRTDIIYWRPLAMPIFFKVGQIFFGLNPTGYHLIVFVFHLINSLLVYYLFRTLKFSKVISFVLFLMYATASFHFVPLSWLSTTSYVIGPTFIFATLILLLKNKLLLAFFPFLAALLSSELSIVVIPMALVLKKLERSTFVKFVPFVIVLIIYLAIRLLIFRPPVTGQYEIMFNWQILRSLFWYFVWFFNVPEVTSTIFFFSQLKSSIVALVPFTKYLLLPLILIISFVPLVLFTKQDIKMLIRGFGLFAIGLFPIIFFPKHVYPMYLVVASIGIFYILGMVFEKARNSLLLGFFVILWLVSSFLALSFYRVSHWLVNEQAISKAYVSYLKEMVSNPPLGSVFVFKDANIDFARRYNFVLVETENTLRLALNDQDAPQVVYNDSTLKSIHKTFPQNSFTVNQVYEVFPRE